MPPVLKENRASREAARRPLRYMGRLIADKVTFCVLTGTGFLISSTGFSLHEIIMREGDK